MFAGFLYIYKHIYKHARVLACCVCAVATAHGVYGAIWQVQGTYAPIRFENTVVGFLEKGERLYPMGEIKGQVLTRAQVVDAKNSAPFYGTVPASFVSPLPVSEANPAVDLSLTAQVHTNLDALLKRQGVHINAQELQKLLKQGPEALNSRIRPTAQYETPEQPLAVQTIKGTRAQKPPPGEGAEPGSITPQLPPDLDMSTATAAQGEVNNPIVTAKPLPVVERTKQTLGKGVQTFELTTASVVMLCIIGLLFLTLIIWVIVESNRKKRAKAIRRTQMPYVK